MYCPKSTPSKRRAQYIIVIPEKGAVVVNTAELCGRQAELNGDQDAFSSR